MSEHDGMDRVPGDGLLRPAAASSAPGSGGTTPGSHAYVAQSPPPRVLARMPDMGPETTAIASEEPVPAPHESRLVGARLSANMLVGGVLVLMLVALAPFLFMKGAGAGRSESPAPSARKRPAGTVPTARSLTGRSRSAGTAHAPRIAVPPGTGPQHRTTARRRASPPSRTRPLGTRQGPSRRRQHLFRPRMAAVPGAARRHGRRRPTQPAPGAAEIPAGPGRIRPVRPIRLPIVRPPAGATLPRASRRSRKRRL